jgi:hypothetical protein
MKSVYRRSFSLLAAVIFLLSPCATAIFHASAEPEQQRPGCPAVSVTCPDMVYLDGKLTFTVQVKGGDPNVTPTYNWTVSAGTIASGQGTTTIEIDITGVAANSTVTATVDVGAFSRECATAASCTS